jgi:predicted NBD/HSP70 family sugar kinase
MASKGARLEVNMDTPGPADIRHGNALACLEVMRNANGALTISDVVSRTRLSRPTVDAVIAGLEARGTVLAAGADSSGTAGGRPARRFVFGAMSGVVAGIDAGPAAVDVVIADLQGRIVSRASRPVESGATGDQRLEILLDSVRAALFTAGVSPDRLRGACVGVSGIIGVDGKLARSFFVPEWNDTDVAGRLAAELGCTVFLENDIKLAAYAEHHLGVARDAECILYFQIGSRISFAYTLNGHIHQGAHRSAGEVASLRGMRWTSNSVRGRLTWHTAATAEQVHDLAVSGDPAATAELDRFTTEIATRIATFSLAFDPDVIVVGDGLARDRPPFIERLRAEVHRLILIDAKPEVIASSLHSDGTLFGALALAFERCSTELFGFDGVPVPAIHSSTALASQS